MLNSSKLDSKDINSPINTQIIAANSPSASDRRYEPEPQPLTCTRKYTFCTLIAANIYYDKQQDINKRYDKIIEDLLDTLDLRQIQAAAAWGFIQYRLKSEGIIPGSALWQEEEAKYLKLVDEIIRESSKAVEDANTNKQNELNFAFNNYKNQTDDCRKQHKACMSGTGTSTQS